MTNPKEYSAPEPRRLACARCGTEFGCDLSGNCWCAEETAKLPMPVKGEDCLCRECLRKAASGAREMVNDDPNSQPSRSIAQKQDEMDLLTAPFTFSRRDP